MKYSPAQRPLTSPFAERLHLDPTELEQEHFIQYLSGKQVLTQGVPLARTGGARAK